MELANHLDFIKVFKWKIFEYLLFEIAELILIDRIYDESRI